MHSYAGTFESHVTVRAESPRQIEQFRSLCQRHNLKCVLIELARGAAHSQPMTATHHRGALEDVLREAQSIAQLFAREGLEVTRVKVEADPDASGIPETDAEAARAPATNYFEFHLLVRLLSLSGLPRLSALCAARDAHLSSNAFKLSPEGEEAERFVTMRLYGTGRARAASLFGELSSAVEEAGYRVSKRVLEYVVYDTNVLLDDGWINPPAHLHDER